MRPFDSKKGDRIARRFDDPSRATHDFRETFNYAYFRAASLGKRQFLKLGNGRFSKSKFLVINTDIPLELPDGR